MAKAEVVIDENLCLGCGYCAEFCPTKSILISPQKFNSQGQLLAEFVGVETCNGCGICAWMCPHFAVEVYKLAATKE
ncbi:MAG: 4Fe-4S binding protein [Candidatus Tectomicrobia bacterium]|uniref:4Fe-4S binding protein n=1 Tax=Tectimicrobiota bacterium TaxID=2528274 RepID=A0A932CP12_UNCTE|nr:4Fe-4S binding protein [Candidatus Tectomicrobia bacterium]